MLFRALFWIAVVAVLMPREPDLGLGKPGSMVADGIKEFAPSGFCKDACAGGLSLAGDIHDTILDNLDRVKRELRENAREHGRETLTLNKLIAKVEKD